MQKLERKNKNQISTFRCYRIFSDMFVFVIFFKRHLIRTSLVLLYLYLHLIFLVFETFVMTLWRGKRQERLIVILFFFYSFFFSSFFGLFKHFCPVSFKTLQNVSIQSNSSFNSHFLWVPWFHFLKVTVLTQMPPELAVTVFYPFGLMKERNSFLSIFFIILFDRVCPEGAFPFSWYHFLANSWQRNLLITFVHRKLF